MFRKPASIISDAARFPASPSASPQAGDWHDVSGHHRYYGSSATNGGERIVESRRGRGLVNLFGF